MNACPPWCDTPSHTAEPNPWHERWRPTALGRLNVVTLEYGEAAGVAVPELGLGLTAREALLLAGSLLEAVAELATPTARN